MNYYLIIYKIKIYKMKEVLKEAKIINKPPQFKENISYIKCVYNIKDHNETQIINYKGETGINEEIESKVKIWNGERAEQKKI